MRGKLKRYVILVLITFGLVPFFHQRSHTQKGQRLFARACVIQGHDSGECMNPEDFGDLMPFCGEVVKYPACVPKYQGSLVARWQNHTVKAKDAWVQERFEKEWDYRKTVESNETLVSLGVDEHGNEGQVISRFLYGLGEDWYVMNDCAKAYRNLFCWINFPRCDNEGSSLVMCRSACENYFQSCGYPRDMWRCGPSEFLNDYEPEEPTMNSRGIFDVYWRSFFPGQPWRDNQFEDDGITPIVVCTPSLDGTANRMFNVHKAVLVISASVTITLIAP